MVCEVETKIASKWLWFKEASFVRYCVVTMSKPASSDLVSWEAAMNLKKKVRIYNAPITLHTISQSTICCCLSYWMHKELNSIMSMCYKILLFKILFVFCVPSSFCPDLVPERRELPPSGTASCSVACMVFSCMPVIWFSLLLVLVGDR